ncbi:hypothetical protein EMPS_01118 [Entomortierella parvispora]|uniref:Mid2 domain-containing protein n=1 Tax=Entomortierella parvispora TaxID=205924 RepID=A0A9P3H2D6_9FUNG|nr:hypothetical protein EMPS_01118 [Entomortierella parvispora]
MQRTTSVFTSGRKKSHLFYLLSTLALLGSRSGTTVQAQTVDSTLVLSFLGTDGSSLGPTQTIDWNDCKILVVPESSPGVPVTYASISASDPKAAMNVYQDRFCQVATGSTVGVLVNTGYLANAVAVRWEGTAHDDRPTGSISLTVFPPKMEVQTEIPVPDEEWVMDPSRGKVLVIVVAVVLALGVLVGIYQVWEAAQYVAPPKKAKKPKTGLNVKKVKKADAYFKKPAMRTEDHQHAFQRLDTPEPGFYRHGTGSNNSARNSQYSEAATTFVDWSSHQQQQHSSQGLHSHQKAGLGGSSNQFRGYDSVSIDMQQQQQPQSGRYNNYNNNYSSSTTRSGSATPDLVHFEEMEDSRSRQRGRGGEVLVPMHTFDSNYHHPYQPSGARTPVRRPSSSRSR